MSNPLSNLKIDYWYKAVLVISAPILILALTVDLKGVENKTVLLFSLSAIFIGIGEWINHPVQQQIVPPSATYPGWLKGEGHPRNNNFLGVLFVLMGLVLVGYTIFSIWV
ncbi:hypothetical protein [Salinimonas chungwhensis]|uniref:hypothetical protein n=1 Tax=Salinimonas chungwhensis TaxID=265425 RepID=UPI000376BA94|nr:hypothetical protein [Salinimonas chungwhensis]